MEFGNLTLKSGLRLIGAIANQLAGGTEAPPLDDYVRVPKPVRNRDALALVAHAEYRWRRNRAKFLPDSLFGEASWDLLLDLYVAGVRGKPVSITSACIASAVPPTTGLRYVKSLLEMGMIARCDDATDQRRSFLTLTPAAREMMEQYLSAQLGEGSRADGWLFVPELLDRKNEVDAQGVG